MSVFSGIIVVIVMVVLYVFLKRKSKKSNVRSVERQQEDSWLNTEFHAVSLKSSAYACEAAKGMQDKRFLSNAAPHLPLPECDALECKCKFLHHIDRRTGGEFRRSPYQQNYGVDGLGQLEEDNRKRKERRQN
jgi:hypothetical protein